MDVGKPLLAYIISHMNKCTAKINSHRESVNENYNPLDDKYAMLTSKYLVDVLCSCFYFVRERFVQQLIQMVMITAQNKRKE